MKIVSVRCGWAARYSYTFTWLGRPVIQLPEDLLRLASRKQSTG